MKKFLLTLLIVFVASVCSYAGDIKLVVKDKKTWIYERLDFSSKSGEYPKKTEVIQVDEEEYELRGIELIKVKVLSDGFIGYGLKAKFERLSTLQTRNEKISDISVQEPDYKKLIGVLQDDYENIVAKSSNLEITKKLHGYKLMSVKDMEGGSKWKEKKYFYKTYELNHDTRFYFLVISKVLRYTGLDNVTLKVIDVVKIHRLKYGREFVIASELNTYKGKEDENIIALFYYNDDLSGKKTFVKAERAWRLIRKKGKLEELSKSELRHVRCRKMNDQEMSAIVAPYSG